MMDLYAYHSYGTNVSISTLSPRNIYNEDYMAMLLVTILTAGRNVNPECWLKFPMACFGCPYEDMHVANLSKDQSDTLNISQSVCNALQNNDFNKFRLHIGGDKDSFSRLRYLAVYEPKVRPNFPVKPDVIYASFQLSSVDSIDIADSTFKIDCSVRQEWFDQRLRHFYDDYLDVNSLSSELWIPDTYFVQAKDGEFIQRVDKGVAMKVRSDGKVILDLRLIIKVACAMEFSNFPMDVQRCLLNIESYGHDIDEIQYVWLDDIETVSNNYKSDLLSQYHLKPLKPSAKTTSYTMGNWSTLTLEFVFKRNSMIFIPALYFPCAMLVFISWITFVLGPEQYPARTYLCVTVMLTVVTVQAALDRSLPKVSYIKAIDLYVLVCIFFISGAFIEYAIVLFMRSKRQVYLYKKLKHFEKHKRTKKRLIRKNFLVEVSNEDEYGKTLEKNKLTNDLLEKDTNLLTRFDRLSKFYLREGWPEKVDLFARAAFPVSFIAFNIIYWVMCSNNTNKMLNADSLSN